METIIVSTCTYFGEKATVLCDGRCEKAWGLKNRPRRRCSFDPDDYAFIADDEDGTAPIDPGTYEGGDAKPSDYTDPQRHNKWCARECERSVMVTGVGEEVDLPTFDRRQYDMR